MTQIPILFDSPIAAHLPKVHAHAQQLFEKAVELQKAKHAGQNKLAAHYYDVLIGMRNTMSLIDEKQTAELINDLLNQLNTIFNSNS